MTNEELMIGDWVHIPSETNRFCQIRSTYDLDEAVLYEPIQLTPEILKKNGFEEVKHYYPYPTYEFRGIEKCVVRVAFPKDSKKTKYEKPFVEIDSEQCWIAHVDTEYIHEFQHALKLCKIDKEIEL